MALIQQSNYWYVSNVMKKLIFLCVFLVGCIHYTPIMSGDCVDRAVNIRQELKAQGYETKLILGLRGKEGHCWVRYKDKDEKWKEIKNY